MTQYTNGQSFLEFPVGRKYKIVYADPPWDYYSFKGNTEKSFLNKKRVWGIAESNYNTLDLESIKSLPVNDISDDDSILFLWATFPNLQQALDVVKAWGFEYKTTAFVWEKYDKTNNVAKKYGLGSYTISNCEIVLLGRKGKFERKSKSVKQIIKSTIGKHSEKPDEIRKRILELCGDLPRIELFARSPIHGWDTWGNDDKLKCQSLEMFN